MQVRSNVGRVKNPGHQPGGKKEKKRATRPGIFPFARMQDHHHAIATTTTTTITVTGHHCRRRYLSLLPSPSLLLVCLQCEKYEMTRPMIDGWSTKVNEWDDAILSNDLNRKNVNDRLSSREFRVKLNLIDIKIYFANNLFISFIIVAQYQNSCNSR